MTKRVRDGSITLDDYHAESLEVARQVGTGLFMIRIDHLIYNDYVCYPLLDGLVIDFIDELRLEIQTNRISPTCSRLWHMPTYQQPLQYSHVTEQKLAKLSYDGTVANESDELHCEKPHLWLDLTQLETLSCTAETHAKANTDFNGALVPE